MPLSEARKKANKKWNDANMKDKYDRIQLVVPKGQKNAIQAAAQAQGESLNEYIKKAVEARMEREKGIVRAMDAEDTEAEKEARHAAMVAAGWFPDELPQGAMSSLTAPGTVSISPVKSRENGTGGYPATHTGTKFSESE